MKRFHHTHQPESGNPEFGAPDCGPGMSRAHHDSPQGHGRGFGRGFGPGGPGFGGFGPGFGPGGPRGSRRANKGDVRSAILSLLADGPSNGYGLIRAIEEKTGGAWRPSPGSIYPTLQQIVDEELISPTGTERRTDYELTEAGRAYLAEHADDLKKAWEATPGQSDSDAAFHESVGKLFGVVHQFRSSATDTQRAAATEKLDEVRRALYLILAD
ncbi:DNA-binding PadR family transcriptional regulator [Cryobacterium sp. MP_3.1]|uniref:PadR family transcriptional regulator n=1 Tax=Cryobacterium sp. MP_3.1 TaxID=3071711 RepID=UPI002E0CBC8B|nr:DNA-binding PadR family transcriptional regulator [Cryobacterium sp. MP_3.1]